jgi:GT2 family glycosyltransferase
MTVHGLLLGRGTMPADDRSEPTRLIALLTSHNRRELTLACLDRLFAQRGRKIHVEAVLLDAGSTDGTADAVEAAFESTTVLRGTADTFWARGMHLAFGHATGAAGGADFYLWLNDDTLLDEDALARLIACHDEVASDPSRPALVAGVTRDPWSGAVTYGGVRREEGGPPLRFVKVLRAMSNPIRVDTINGNCVLVSDAVVQRIGLIDPTFFHALADFDYGLRAAAAGCEVWIAPGTVGLCRDHTLPDSRWARIRSLGNPRRMRVRDWYIFARRWGGPRWYRYLPSPFLRHAYVAVVGDQRER